MNRENNKSSRSGLIHFDNVSKIYLGNSVAVEDIILRLSRLSLSQSLVIPVLEKPHC